ncbi:MAG: hypothetical protein Kow0059_22850 [Candidatus Sumerlaeia bacterium]
MQKPGVIVIVVAACLGVVAAAMGWFSATVLRLDRAEAEARRQAALEENMRLALWRMDSVLAPLLARESTRPFFFYQSFYPAERPYARMFEAPRPGESLTPSPLLTLPPGKILLHFQIAPDGGLSSPQSPAGPWRERAVQAGAREADLAVADQRLNQLARSLTRDTALAALAGRDAAGGTSATSGAADFVPGGLIGALDDPQQIRNVVEYAKRREISQRAGFGDYFSRTDAPGGEAAMTPVWVNGMLLLLRRLTINDQPYIQGCWLNWPELRAGLLAEVRDLLPAADLRPIPPEAADPRAGILTSLPVQLVPGRDAATAGVSQARSVLAVPLVVAWVCVLLAGGAVAALLVGTMRLSERRATFVSAVTHELRTPITSLRMYTEMLAAGMVRDEARTHEYLTTMHAEADRLGHLVENVLTYSRLERGRARSRIELLALAELIERVKPRLIQRARQEGRSIAVRVADHHSELRVRVDITAVEQILFNLVDNACKYARVGEGADRATIHLEAGRNGPWAELRVRDHGPGIAPGDADRLFRPFAKSAHEAADSAPGVGLGLALSRRLARMMGGELDLDRSVRDGACFVLMLPPV